MRVPTAITVWETRSRNTCLLFWRDMLSTTNLCECLCWLFFGGLLPVAVCRCNMLWITFQGAQIIANAIMYFPPPHTHNVNAAQRRTRAPYLVSHGLETRCVHYTAHPYGRRWHLAQNISVIVKQPAAPGVPRETRPGQRVTWVERSKVLASSVLLISLKLALCSGHVKGGEAQRTPANLS